MNVIPILAAVVFSLAYALPGSAAAQRTAYSTPGGTDMFAGPGAEFPVVARLPGGSPLGVHGCLSNYSWCDVAFRSARGWISASQLEFVYADQRVLVPRYTADFVVPLIEFDSGYWDRYHSEEPWYADWQGGEPRRLAPPVAGGGRGGPQIEGPGAEPRPGSPIGGVAPPPVPPPGGGDGPSVVGGGAGGPGIEGGGAVPGTSLCPPEAPDC